MRLRKAIRSVLVVGAMTATVVGAGQAPASATLAGCGVLRAGGPPWYGGAICTAPGTGGSVRSKAQCIVPPSWAWYYGPWRGEDKWSWTSGCYGNMPTVDFETSG